MTQSLPQWATALLQALEIEPVQVDVDTLTGISTSLDEEPAHAELLVGFIAGYAAGLAQGSDMASYDRAHAASVQFMRQYVSRK